jgi:hypothetical protein
MSLGVWFVSKDVLGLIAIPNKTQNFATNGNFQSNRDVDKLLNCKREIILI